jgi:hypothetical protein
MTLPAAVADNKSSTRKKRFNSKGKGNGFEGTVAKKLSAALQPLNFIRTPGSGARVGGKNFETIGKMFGADALKIFVGDVVPVNEQQEGLKFHHSIECKFYSTPDSFTSLMSGTSNLFKWFREAVDDASKVDKSPMLIWKWNHTPIFVAVDTMDSKSDYTILTAAGVKPRITLLKYGHDAGGRHSLDIYELDDLLPHTAFWFSKY